MLLFFIYLLNILETIEMVSDKMSKEAKKSSAKSVVSSKVNASKKINGAKKAKISGINNSKFIFFVLIF